MADKYKFNVFTGKFDIVSEFSSPLTTKGDIYAFSTVDARFPVGTNGHTIIADSTQPLGIKWAAIPGGGDMLISTYDTAGVSEQLLGLTATQTLTNKTIDLTDNTLSGTKADFNTALSDGSFIFVGDAPTAHTHLLAAGATDVDATAAEVNVLDLSATALTAGWGYFADAVSTATWRKLLGSEITNDESWTGATDISGKADIDQTMYIGTTGVAINRGTAALTLAGITLTTPDIGTPSAGVLTNATGLPVTGLANGTDGQLITWGADAVATTVATGDADQVLTSNGAGAAPTFQDAPGGIDTTSRSFAWFIN